MSPSSEVASGGGEHEEAAAPVVAVAAPAHSKDASQTSESTDMVVSSLSLDKPARLTCSKQT